MVHIAAWMRYMNLFLSFISQSFNGVELGRFLGWIPSEEDARERAYGETHDYCPCLDGYWPVGQQFDGVGSADSYHYSDDASGDAEEDGFNEELVQDVHAAGADAHSETDLTGSLGDADVHDVHYSDTSDNE